VKGPTWQRSDPGGVPDRELAVANSQVLDLLGGDSQKVT